MNHRVSSRTVAAVRECAVLTWGALGFGQQKYEYVPGWQLVPSLCNNDVSVVIQLNAVRRKARYIRARTAAGKGTHVAMGTWPMGHSPLQSSPISLEAPLYTKPSGPWKRRDFPHSDHEDDLPWYHLHWEVSYGLGFEQQKDFQPPL